MGVMGVLPWGWGEPPEWWMPGRIPERCWYVSVSENSWVLSLALPLPSWVPGLPVVSLSLSFLIC